jgi:hypothetical protein
MRAYVVVTGVVFGLMTAAHVWRFIVEGHVATDPLFVAITVISTAFAVWAGRLVWPKSRS